MSDTPNNGLENESIHISINGGKVDNETEANKESVVTILSDEETQEIINQEEEIRKKEKEIKELLGIIDLNENNVKEVKRILALDIPKKEQDLKLEELLEKSNREEKHNILSHYINGLLIVTYFGINGLRENNNNIDIIKLRENINYFGIIYELLKSEERDEFTKFLIEEFNKKDSKGLSIGELTTKEAIIKYKQSKQK